MLAPWAQQQVLTWLLTTGTPDTRPTDWYVALHTGDPGTGGDNELTTGADANYVRKAVDFTVALNGNQYEADNDAGVAFDPAGAGASYTVTHVTVKDALTTGNTILIVPLPVSIPVVEGGLVSIPISELLVEGGA